MSRFHAVRALDFASGLGPAQILDYGHAHARPRLLPHPGKALDRSRAYGTVYAEWLHTPAGVWLPRIAGGSPVYSGEYQLPHVAWPGEVTYGDTGGVTALALDSAYTYNSANDAIAVRVTASAAKTLASVYLFVTAVAGTPTGLNLEIRRNNTATTPVTGSSSVATTTAAPSLTPTRWNKVTWSVAGIGGHATDRYFWLIIADADGAASVRWNVARFMSSVGPRETAVRLHKSFSTTGGWASAITDDLLVSMIVLVFSDGTAHGWPFSNTSSGSAGSTQRGLRVVGGFTAATKIFGYRFSATATPTAVFCWEGTAGPSAGTNLLSGITVQLPEAGSAIFAPITLAANTGYRFTASAGALGVRRFVLGTLASGTAAELFAASVFGADAYYTEESGGTWGADVTTDLPQWALLIEDQIAAAGGSGGGLRAAGRGGLAVGA